MWSFRHGAKSLYSNENGNQKVYTVWAWLAVGVLKMGKTDPGDLGRWDKGHRRLLSLGHRENFAPGSTVPLVPTNSPKKSNCYQVCKNPVTCQEMD